MTDPKPKLRWFQFSKRKLLVLLGLAVMLLGTYVLFPPFWSAEYRRSWTADYDRARYNQIRTAIAADPQHLVGKSLDEVTKALNLQDVPWDDGGLNQAGPEYRYRIYHFRGFACYLLLALQPNGVLRIDGMYPFVRIDGISGGKERMKQYWKALHEEYEYINAETRQRRQTNGR